MIDWATESPLIEHASDDYNVDPAFIKSIREQENGRIGYDVLRTLSIGNESAYYMLSSDNTGWHIEKLAPSAIEPFLVQSSLQAIVSASIVGGSIGGNTIPPPRLVLADDNTTYVTLNAYAQKSGLNISVIATNIESAPDFTGYGTETKLTLSIENDTDAPNNLSVLGSSYSVEAAASDADIQQIWPLYIGTIATRPPNFSVSTTTLDLHIRGLTPSLQKLPSAPLYVVIVTPQNTIRNWMQSCSSDSHLVLTISSQGIWLDELRIVPSIAFGVLSTSAPTYDDQLRICCITVAHRLASYTGNPLMRGPISRRLVYSPDWIKYFANIWAPVSASPMNESWLPNVLSFYAKWVADG